MEPLSRPELYKWQRITSKTRKTGPIKTESVTDDIEQWIKKVEQASDFAAAQAFGKARTEKSTKASILQTVDQLHDHDAAYDEAQELLNGWVNDQLHVVEDHSTEAAIWSDDEKVEDSSFEPSIQNIIQQTDANAISMEEYDRLMNLDNYNEDVATQNILDQLRRKEVVKPEFLRDLGDIGGQPTISKLKKDPSVKMQIRQNQVKESKEKRRLDLLKKREQEAARKKVVSLAKQQAAEERRKSALKTKQDEIEIQKEMVRIKKELQEDRRGQLRKQEEERELERRIAQVAKDQTRSQGRVPSTPHSTVPESSIGNSAEDRERKRRLAKSLEIAETKFVSHNLKLMKKCFNTWFDIVLEKRVQLGKARAVSDWKCLFRSWNAWRHFTRERTLGRLKLQHENNMIEDHRKLHQSSAHCDRRLLKRYFLQWQIWVTQQRQARELANDQRSVREKMTAFLTAGKRLAEEPEAKPITDRHSESRVNGMFTESKYQRVNQRPQTSRNRQLPTEAWQITRKHLKLTSKQIYDITDTPTDKSPEVDAFEEATSTMPTSPSTDTSSSQATMRIPKSFHNRFQAQQKILQEQQQALREQKKMIEDLTYKQDRSLLEEQAKQQQVIQHQLEKLTKLTLQEKKLNSVVPPSPTSKQQTNNNECPELEPPQTSRSQLSSASRVTSASSAFSRRMEARAEERAKAKDEREEKKRKQEEQHVAELIAKEEEIRQQEAEEKKRRIEIFKEKRKQEKQRELELLKLKEKSITDQREAGEHSRLRILKFYGFIQLKQHYIKMKELGNKAREKYSHSLQSQTWQLWKLRYDTNTAVRNERADELYERHLVRRYFTNWTQWRLQSQILTSKADIHYHSKLISTAFQGWLEITTREKIEMWEKERHARQHDVLRLKLWAFSTWKRLPEDRRMEAEKEKRREEMRRRVSSMLPDFK